MGASRAFFTLPRISYRPFQHLRERGHLAPSIFFTVTRMKRIFIVLFALSSCHGRAYLPEPKITETRRECVHDASGAVKCSVVSHDID